MDQTCPKCGSDSLAVPVKTWANFYGGEPLAFDDEDLDSVEPVIGADIICRDCQYEFPVK